MADQNDDIEKYVKGELTPAEMHRLEKRALTDPFLSDALEGAASVKKEEFISDVEFLQKRFTENRRTQFSVWRIAAVLAVFVAGSYSLYIAFRPTSPQKMLATQSKPLSAPPKRIDAMDSAVKTNDQHQKEKLLSLATEPAKSEKQNKKVAQDASGAKPVPPSAQPASAVPVSGADVAAGDVAAVTEYKNSEEVPATNADAATMALPNASHPLAQNKVPDRRAKKDNSKNQEPAVISALSSARSAAPADKTIQDFILINATAEQTNDSAFHAAAPNGGVFAFHAYLDQNLKYPPIALRKRIEGMVTISFHVLSDGTLSDFKVKQGIGSGCEEELFRLVKEGPTWSPQVYRDITRSSEITLGMKFILPD